MGERHRFARICMGLGAAGCALLIFGAGPARAQVASPLQAGHYAPGVMNIRDMGFSAPGLYVMWINWSPWSNTYVDRFGNELENLGQLDPDLPNADVSISGQGYASVPALAWTSTFSLLGGARYLVSLSPNYVIADYTFTVVPGEPGGPDGPEGGIIDDRITGFSDLFFSPFGLTWALSPHFDATFAYGITAPTGRFELGAGDNTGLGFWTHQFQGFGYFYPSASQATAIMAGLTFETNSNIKDLDFRPGNRLSLDWGVSQYFTDWFELGVQGGHNWQVSDDTGEDVLFDPSFHDQRSMLGISAGFWPWSQRLYVNLKYTHDFAVRQAFKNNSLMLNFIWVTNALDGM